MSTPIYTPPTSRVPMSLAELGLTGEVTARDHWKREDIGAFRDTFGTDLPKHGAGLYRITPQRGMKERRMTRRATTTAHGRNGDFSP